MLAPLSPTLLRCKAITFAHACSPTIYSEIRSQRNFVHEYVWGCDYSIGVYESLKARMSLQSLATLCFVSVLLLSGSLAQAQLSKLHLLQQ